MKRVHQPLTLLDENPLSNRFRILCRGRIRTVFHILFRLSSWTGVAWVVWNHALAGFFNADRVTFFEALGIGILLYVLSMVFEDSDRPWHKDAASESCR